MLQIDPDKCNACGLCESVCPFGAIAVAGKCMRVNESCTLCSACVGVCPQQALRIPRRQASADELARHSGVFVWIECEGDVIVRKPRQVGYEILAQARRLADQSAQEVTAVVLGDHRMTGLESLCHRGADRVLCCRHDLLGRYSSDGFTHALAAVVAKEKPSILLYGATPNGRDLAPRVAARLRLGLTADCTGLHIDEDGRLMQTRPAFGGNIMATIVSPYTRPQSATVRPNVFRALPADPTRPVIVENMTVSLSRTAIRTRFISETRVADELQTIDEARVIVSAGRGCQDPSNLDTLRELAARLGGTLAGSRAVVELGWLPHSLQVGQSGTTVGPDLYVAVGISGAVQHVVGMSASGKVIAINRDPDAPIFKIADLGVVGDAMAILPILIDEIERLGTVRPAIESDAD